MVKLSHKLPAFTIIPTIISIIIFGGLSFHIFKTYLIGARILEATTLINLATHEIKDPVNNLNLEEMKNVIKNTKNNTNVLSVYILRPDGSVITDGTDENKLYNQMLKDDLVETVIETNELLGKIKEEVLQIANPIITTENIGIFRMEFSLKGVNILINELIFNLFMIGIPIIVFVVCTGFLLSSSVTEPIIKLRNAAIKLRKGERRKLHIKSKDEIGDLSKSFNRMASELCKKELHLKKRAKQLEKAKRISMNSLKEVKASRKKLQKAYKEIKRIEVLKSNFMNIAAHELKTPLIPIIGYTDMILENKTLPKKFRKTFEIVYRNAKREERLINAILDISRMEAKAMKFHMERLQITDVIKGTLNDMIPFAKKKGLKIIKNVPSRLPLVTADKFRIGQVLRNLISNAIKFTEKGEITIEAKRKGRKIEVSVTDTGMGIPEKDMPKLFTKFFQVETSAKRIHGGTGLGLAICKGIIKHHKGKIRVKSTLGKGSTFTFSLPIGGKNI